MNQITFIEKVRSILSDNNSPRSIGSQRSGSGIDEGVVALAPSGFNRVFRRKARRVFSNYRIILLVDCSGSMRGAEIESASECVHMMYYSLKVAGFEPRVFGFNRGFREVTPALVEEPDKLLEFLLDFMHETDEDKEALGNGNHDSFAVSECSRLLNQSTSGGKILFVFSDGRPACSGCGHPGHESNNDITLSSSIKKARKAGIACLAVGIGTNAATEFYGERFSVRVDRLSDLYKHAARLLERNLVRG